MRSRVDNALTAFLLAVLLKYNFFESAEMDTNSPKLDARIILV